MLLRSLAFLTQGQMALPRSAALRAVLCPRGRTHAKVSNGDEIGLEKEKAP